MIERTIFGELTAHLTRKQATVITGMRRVGKSTALRYLLNQTGHSNYTLLDLEKAEDRYLLNQPMYQDVELDLKIRGINLQQPAVIAIDEIQLVKNAPSVIKYLYDTYNIKFLLTGSSSYYLKNHFSESLAGRKRIFEMYPLNFREFLQFQGQPVSVLDAFAGQPFRPAIYTAFRESYEAFLRFGGFPEVVLAETNDDKTAYLKDIINAYIELDIRLLADFSVSDDLVRLLRLLATNTGSKIDYQKIGSLLGISRLKIKDYLTLLEYTYFIQTVPAFSQNAAREIAQQRKLYLSDTGVLNQLAQVSGGQAFENAMANQLRWLGDVRFYQRKTGQEIDFILNEKTAIEIKETPAPADLQTLKRRAASLGLTDILLVGRYQSSGSFNEFTWEESASNPYFTMRRHLFTHLLSLGLFAACQSAQDPQRIIEQCIDTHGGNRYQSCRIEFDFRKYHLSLYQHDGQFKYQRTYTDSAGVSINEVLTNNDIIRTVNGQPMVLDSAQQRKYSDAVNAVSYFVLLPYKLSDAAAIKEYAGETTIDGQVYDKIRVSFSQAGGGNDFGDVFFYWINQKSHTLDYLAYSEGGPRFRKAINPQTVGGIRFQDYVNYKGDDADSAAVGTFDQKYQQGKLKILSQIEQKNIRVTPMR